MTFERKQESAKLLHYQTYQKATSAANGFEMLSFFAANSYFLMEQIEGLQTMMNLKEIGAS